MGLIALYYYHYNHSKRHERDRAHRRHGSPPYVFLGGHEADFSRFLEFGRHDKKIATAFLGGDYDTSSDR
jgi:hypothetical protein